MFQKHEFSGDLLQLLFFVLVLTLRHLCLVLKLAGGDCRFNFVIDNDVKPVQGRHELLSISGLRDR